MRRKYVSLKTPKAVTPHKVNPTATPKPKTVRLDDIEHKPILAVDFDNTLTLTEKYPFIDGANEQMVNFLKEHGNDFFVILWTCRDGKQLQYALDWCKEQGLHFDAVNENAPWLKAKYHNDPRKIYADYYIDDHAYTAEDFLRVMYREENLPF